MAMRKSVLLAFLSLPILLVIGLVVFVLRTPVSEKHLSPPVGAGAGHTGGANAIGQWAAERNKPQSRAATTHGLTLASYSHQPATQPAAQPPATQPKFVQPEAYEHGFILVVEDKSGLANKDDPIYMAGTFNNWNAGDIRYQLEPQSDIRWRFTFPKLEEGKTLSFKFTRGSWDKSEISSDDADTTNRTLEPVDVSGLSPGEPIKIQMVVEKWADQRGPARPSVRKDGGLYPYRTIPVEGDLRRLQVTGGAATAAGQVRDLLVWLPPGYDAPENASRSYPVLFMHDGQNIFEKHPQIPAEWQMDETLTRLIKSKSIEPIIVVGIPHSGIGRISEYLPVSPIPNVKADGDTHVKWLISEVLPRVQAAFRVRTDPAHVGIGGSSLGAIIALHAATLHPEAFGLVLAESLPLRTGDKAVWEQWLGGMKSWPTRIFMGMGGREGLSGEKTLPANEENPYVVAVKAFDQRLSSAGVSTASRKLVIDPAAEHNEQAWAKRLPEALEFLFPPEAASK
jgi:predicted alpha/beta superfamily hydrolase